MEINCEDGSKLRLEAGQKKHFGRGNGFNPTDRTISRRHVSFQLVNKDDDDDETRVHFQVIGKNPMWVHYSKTDEIKIFRFLEIGEMCSGDMFCVSGKKPMWFHLKRLQLDGGSRELGLESQLGDSFNVQELDFNSIDVSDIDPVKEFGFVVMGHEFDCHPNKMIRDIKNWDWFIDEPGEEESENDEVGVSRRKGGGRRKRKKSGGEDDDEWTGESDEDKEVLVKSSKIKRPKYSTRSKGSDKPVRVGKIHRNAPQSNDEEDDESEDKDDEDDDDETLGGFIVDEDSAGEDLENDDEEDEFEEEDDDEE